jgi:hypothetical protein
MTGTIDGQTVSLPIQPMQRSAVAGGGTYTCEGDFMSVQVADNPAPIEMDRQA